MTVKIASALVGVALGVGVLFGYVATVTTAVHTAWEPVADQPWCPEEDSCWPDYVGDGNRWEIVELNP